MCKVFVDDDANGWLVFVLLGVDASLSDGCGIGEHLHSFGEVKCFQDYSETLWRGV